MDETTVHLLAGGIGGTVGAVATCPLEVLKVRLQSSAITLAGGMTVSSPLTTPSSAARAGQPTSPSSGTSGRSPTLVPPVLRHVGSSSSSGATSGVVMRSPSMGVMECVRSIARTEGLSALFKGIGPTLVGVLPARCIYFSAYHNGQTFFSQYFKPNSSSIFFCSAAVGGFVTATLTNPIFYIKTKLQLDQSPGKSHLRIWQATYNTWKTLGLLGFYKGVSASYVGISETVINFVIYERVKADLLAWRHSAVLGEGDPENADVSSRIRSPGDMGLCMLASVMAKTIATLAAYPHEVIRTRLREDPTRYRRFLQALILVGRQEGAAGLYGGLLTHYIRQVPNTCIMMGVYEMVLYFYREYGLSGSASPENY